MVGFFLVGWVLVVIRLGWCGYWCFCYLCVGCGGSCWWFFCGCVGVLVWCYGWCGYLLGWGWGWGCGCNNVVFFCSYLRYVWLDLYLVSIVFVYWSVVVFGVGICVWFFIGWYVYVVVFCGVRYWGYWDCVVVFFLVRLVFGYCFCWRVICFVRW